MRALFLLLFVWHANAAPQHDVWIWPRAYRSLASTSGASDVFVLQGEVSQEGRFVSRGPSPWAWPVHSLTLVFRLQARPNVEQIARDYSVLAKAWAARGVLVRGLQLDYDSPTSKIGFYRDDLAKLSLRVPHLSVTGLTDWLQLREFSLPVTVYFQLYRGSREHSELEMSLARLARAKFPFKIGLLPHQTLTASQLKLLQSNKNFLGFADFYGGPIS